MVVNGQQLGGWNEAESLDDQPHSSLQDRWPPPPPRPPQPAERADPRPLRLIPNPAAAPAIPPPPPEPSLALAQRSPTTDLDSELQAAREELQALHDMFEELPSIFERKFQQRLRGVLEQQHRLLQDNRDLKRQLAHLLPAGVPPVSRQRPRLMLPPALDRAGEGLGQTLRQVLRRGREESHPIDPHSEHA